MRGVALACLALLAPGCAFSSPETAAVGGVVLLAAPPGGGRRFLGSEACRGCHRAVYERWLSTGHARDHAGLPVPDRGNPACLRCHVTGYGDPLGYRGEAGTPGLAAVGCEACHGAAADHALSRHPGLVPTDTGGECPPCEVNRICRLCHTAEQSPDFELARSLQRVACGPGAPSSR